MFEDDFDFEDLDFSCYDQDESRSEACKARASSPQGKVLKKHEGDFIHALVEDTPPRENLGNVKATKRKFPGPAGLLPERVNFQSATGSDCVMNSSVNSSKDKQDIEQASSQFVSIFESNAWKCAQYDIEQSGFQGIQSCNIAHLKRCAFSNKSKALKYPFLAVGVSNMDNGQDLFVTLRDSTGEIQGHINSEVLEQFPMELRRGCVLILKKVGVLKIRQARGLYLLITPNNLAVIYPSDLGVSKLEMLKESCKDVDFSNLDTSLNTSSLYTSGNETPPRQARLSSNVNHSNHSTPNSTPRNNFVAPRTSTPNVDNTRRPPAKLLPQCTNYSRSSPHSFSSNKITGLFNSAQSTSNVSSQPKLSSENNHLKTHVQEPKVLERSFTVLSQNGVNRGDLSTVSSLFEGVDTDSIFDDF